MSTNPLAKLIFTLALTSVFLSGCKSGSKSNTVTTNRGKPTATSPTGPRNESGKDPKGLKSDSPQTDSQKLEDIDGDSTSDKSEPIETTATRCDQYKKSLEEIGWEQKSVSSRLNPDDTNSKKITVNFFIQKNSQFKNPVLVLAHARNELSSEMAEKILSLAKSHQFDPIYVDSRGFGCSEKLPIGTELKQLVNFSARAQAFDFETIRKSLIKEKKWKVWSYGNASLAALRLAELYPNTISGLYLADFALTQRPLELIQARLSKQIETWEEFKNFAKNKNLDLSDSTQKKIHENLNKATCTSLSKLCGKPALNLTLLKLLSGDDSDWEKAVQLLIKIEKGESLDELNNLIQASESHLRYDMLLNVVDRGFDLYGKTCQTALSDSELKENLDKSWINSCAIDDIVLAELRTATGQQLSHQVLNIAQVQKNLAAAKAVYFVSMSQKSLLNPISLVETHKSLLKDVMVDDFDSSLGSETFTNEGLLEKLKN